MSDQGFKKVGRKARRGRRRRPQPHADHRSKRATRDPVWRSKAKSYRRRRAELQAEAWS